MMDVETGGAEKWWVSSLELSIFKCSTSSPRGIFFKGKSIASFFDTAKLGSIYDNLPKMK